jgi:hypothetical protein
LISIPVHVFSKELMLTLNKACYPYLIFVPKNNKVREELDQMIGGGKLQQIQLYVDSQKVPFCLLDANTSQAHDLPARTISLNLIYQTSTEYIVIPIDKNCSQAWVLKADAVYAVEER